MNCPHPDLGIVCAADLEIPTPPRYPRVVHRGRDRQAYLKLADGRLYRVPADPVKVLGLLDHLACKTWCDGGFLHLAISRIAAERDWQIHPF